MYDSINKQLVSFPKLLSISVSFLASKGLKDVFLFHIYPWATQHYVTGNISPASCLLRDPALTGCYRVIPNRSMKCVQKGNIIKVVCVRRHPSLTTWWWVDALSAC